MPETQNIEYNSRTRNPKIAKACFMAGYIDTWGRGTLKIINACKEAGLPEPDIKEINGGVEVVIYSKTTDDTTGGQVGGQVGGAIGGQVGGAIGGQYGLVEGLVEGLAESQQKIVRLVEKNPKISIREMAEQIGISTTAIDKNIVTLKEKNIIRRAGGGKHGRWEIILDK